ncbi:MAG TPA: VOC family protein [Leptospiraceae bacterium]|nr:VOC family protein [Leptospiraceae bacterium]HMW04048.1 VOC family protein [Leptospiraceae bacterium]HMX30938.1 VOC family protein [Leptospiraceae bacterium]HMY30042.1 VOC family protein [Leptospiraceae bacterium]HMZ62771.1 VOC family protein [Leptospiraceae bacterium]
MSDFGLTHIALDVLDIDKSISFYQKYAGMQIVHRRVDANINVDVVWLSDLTRPFVIVLLKSKKVEGRLLPQCHLGVACKTREDVNRLCELAKADGILLDGPNEWAPPVGYWAYIKDPDGNTLELSFGQVVHFTIEQAANSN